MAKKTKKAKKAKHARSTALVLARKSALKPAAVTVLPPERTYSIAADGTMQLGALGLVELKLTEEEERVCSEAVNPDDVQWRPSRKNGPKDIPYLPHHVYTRWFNRAFGRTGWNLVPVGKPTKSDTNVVLLPYVLHVHKLPVAFAWGEQEYFDRKASGEENRSQSYGDVIESTVGSALRRCAKHLGIGLELWDKTWTERLRKPGDPEPRQQQRQERNTQQRRREAPVEHADLDKVITDDQRLKLWNTSRRVGRGDQEVQDWLKRRFKIATSSDISRRDYDRIIEAIEQRGPLPEKD
jgi:hypothetical protein